MNELFEIGFVVEGGVSTGLLAAVFAHAGRALVAGRDSRRGEALTRMRAVTLLEEAAERPLAIGIKQQVALFAALAPSLAAAERDRLADLAAASGLISAAERWCSSRWWWRRLRGVRVLDLLGRGVAIVPALFDDPRPEVRAEVAAWAAAWPLPAVIDRLLGMLGDPENVCRFTVKDSLVRIGRPAVSPLAARLGNLQGLALTEALEVARHIAEPQLLDSAFALFERPDPDVRALCAELAGAVGGEAATERLIGLLHDAEPGVRAASARSLGRLGHWPAASALQQLLRDRSWDVRSSAATALAALGPPGVLLLRQALGDGDRFARDIARQALGLRPLENLLAT